MTTPVSTEARPLAAFQVREVAAPHIAPKEPPVPKESQAGIAWKKLKTSPHGRAVAIWGGNIGKVAALGTPVVLTAAAGYAIGAHNLWGVSQWFGLGLGAIAGGIGILAQNGGPADIIPTYERAGAKYPYLAGFLNVVGYMTFPAAAGGYAVAHLTNGAWGVAAAVACGISGAFLGMTAQNERLKDHPAPKKN